jgi:hypothetical protein
MCQRQNTRSRFAPSPSPNTNGGNSWGSSMKQTCSGVLQPGSWVLRQWQSNCGPAGAGWKQRAGIRASVVAEWKRDVSILYLFRSKELNLRSLPCITRFAKVRRCDGSSSSNILAPPNLPGVNPLPLCIVPSPLSPLSAHLRCFWSRRSTACEIEI